MVRGGGGGGFEKALFTVKSTVLINRTFNDLNEKYKFYPF